MTAADRESEVQAAQDLWRAGRRYLNENRFRLSRLAERLHAGTPKVRGLLTADSWIPSAPIPLENLTLLWADDDPPAQVRGLEPSSAPVRSLMTADAPYNSYADALGSLARPSLFEDRPCYRLTDLSTEGDKVRLSFGRATFFDIINICEAAAHEFAQVAERTWPEAPPQEDLPFRRFVDDPCDLSRRSVIPAISVLTIRRSQKDGPTIVLHRRDGAKVAHGGGLYQVMPVGIFQPSAPEPWNESNDLDLWRSIAREYSEEFLGTTELAGREAPIDYDGWPFFASLQQAREAGGLGLYWLGLGVDPLSFVADLLVVAVFDEDVFDSLFDRIVATNAEGEIIDGARTGGEATGIPFDQATVERFAGQEPMQAAGAAVLDLAWAHRARLLNE